MCVRGNLIGECSSEVVRKLNQQLSMRGPIRSKLEYFIAVDHMDEIRRDKMTG